MGTSLPAAIPYPFNVFDGLALASQYARARDTAGLTRISLPFGGDAWLATRYDDVRLVLSDRRFSRAEATRRDDAPRAFPRVAGGIVMTDAPELTRLRKLVTQAFTHQRVESLRPHVRQKADALIDRMIEAGAPADLVRDFALPIPMSVICTLLGVPVEDQAKFKTWNDSLLSTNALSAEQTMANLGALSQYIGSLIQQRQAEPRDDLMTALVESRVEDDRLSERELVPLCIAILVAGYEGVSSQIPNFVFTLLSTEGGLERLRGTPASIEATIEELLRFVPLASAAMFVHYATEDVEIGGTTVRAGDAIFASIGSANRDERRFGHADTIDYSRNTKGHFAFGCGLHHCIGASLARVELQESLHVLASRLPTLKLAEKVEWKTSTFFRGPLSMPVSW